MMRGRTFGPNEEQPFMMRAILLSLRLTELALLRGRERVFTG